MHGIHWQRDATVSTRAICCQVSQSYMAFMLFEQAACTEGINLAHVDVADAQLWEQIAAFSDCVSHNAPSVAQWAALSGKSGNSIRALRREGGSNVKGGLAQTSDNLSLETNLIAGFFQLKRVVRGLHGSSIYLRSIR